MAEKAWSRGNNIQYALAADRQNAIKEKQTAHQSVPAPTFVWSIPRNSQCWYSYIAVNQIKPKMVRLGLTEEDCQPHNISLAVFLPLLRSFLIRPAGLLSGYTTKKRWRLLQPFLTLYTNRPHALAGRLGQSQGSRTSGLLPIHGGQRREGSCKLWWLHVRRSSSLFWE